MITARRIFAAFLTFGGTLTADESRAHVDWISESTSCEAGKSLQTAVRMVIDPGWHTYWINPGDGGMKTSIEWKLPAGWKVEEFGNPVPRKYRSGDLVSFGYEGTVLFPVMLKAPVDFTHAARLQATVTWLACNEGACVPGEKEISLEIEAGSSVPSPHVDIISTARRQVPVDGDGDYELDVSEGSETITLQIRPRHEKVPPLLQTLAFPVTQDVIQVAAEIRFVSEPATGHWSVTVPKSEYLRSPVEQLELVLVATGADGLQQASPPSISLKWRKSH